MRCPKCGYISYDHLEECLKCKKNIKSVSDGLQGSVFNVTAPVFLQLQPEASAEISADNMDMFADDELVEEFVDEDLEVLIQDEDDNETDDEIVFAEEQIVEEEVETEISFSDKSEEEADSEFELDFSQLEDTPEPEVTHFDGPEEVVTDDIQEKEDFFALDLPDELTDISDLAPPDNSVGAGEDIVFLQDSKDADIATLDLGELDFELGLEGLEEESLVDMGGEEAVLDLGNIDFTEALADIAPKPSAKSADMSMDEELNFDLDLGGLSIHDDV